jgi:hypothetical protein
MSFTGGNWTNHRERKDIEKDILKFANALGIEDKLPALNTLNWNTLRNLYTSLWCHYIRLENLKDD